MLVRLKEINLSSKTLWINLTTVLYFLFISFQIKPVRVGDGSEYFAQYLSFTSSFTPWLTDRAAAAYAKIQNAGVIEGLVPVEVLQRAFPALAVHQGQWDFNHFWMYALVPAIIGLFLQFIGVAVNIQVPFVLFHLLLTLILINLSFKKFQMNGVLAVCLILMSSPALWFSAHVHTEYFTITLTLIAVVLFIDKKYALASLPLAIASTQNPSFAAVSFCCVVVALYANKNSQKTNLQQALCILCSFLFAIAHPIYYYFRYGVLTPQSIGGGLAFGENISTSLVWFFDPDIGLFANWPLIWLVLLITVLGMKAANFRPNAFSMFALVFVGVSVVAQSSTTNLNSGATVNMARYATWYLCLFLPLMILFVEKLKMYRKGAKKYILTSVLFLVVSTNVLHNWPQKVETYSAATLPSFLIQKYLPDIYDPPAEIFAERFSGVGENIWTSKNFAILGPSCTKALVERSDMNELVVFNIWGCRIDNAKISQLNKYDIAKHKPAYTRFTLLSK